MLKASCFAFSMLANIPGMYHHAQFCHTTFWGIKKCGILFVFWKSEWQSLPWSLVVQQGFLIHEILQKPLSTDSSQAALCIQFPHVQEVINRSNIWNNIAAHFLRVFIHLLSLELEEAPRTWGSRKQLLFRPDISADCNMRPSKL